MKKHQIIITVALIVLGILFYAPYVYILTKEGYRDFLSLAGGVFILTIIAGTCIVLLGSSYNKLSKQ